MTRFSPVQRFAVPATVISAKTSYTSYMLRKTILQLTSKLAITVALTGLLLSACDGFVQLCGEYACVHYQSDCQSGKNCEQTRQCESAGSIRDRAPRILNELREARRACAGNAISNPLAAEYEILGWDEALTGLSESHARDMADNNFVSFVGSNGLTTKERARDAGITASNVVESIHSGPQTAAEAINFWLDVETDCQQLINTNTTRLGMACSISDQNNNGPYWSLLLAGPETQTITQ